jgi:serine protease Do
MNSKKLQAICLTVGLALFTSTGLPVLAAAERLSPLRTTDSDSRSAVIPVSDSGVAGLRALGDTFADVAARIKPSVVKVFSEKTVRRPSFQWPFGDDSPFRRFFGNGNDDSPQSQPRRSPQQGFKQAGMGSGVIIDKEGHILTNHHVVDDMDRIKVILPGDDREYDAIVVGTDPTTDLAVIKIKDKLPRDLQPAILGDSNVLRVGDWVLAVGAPFGYEQTVTAGIISAKGRTGVEEGKGKFEDFLQTDAAINPGNSGGPMVNLNGEVVGINTAIATGGVGQFAGIGFAIPINMAKPIVRDLIKSGHVTRGMLGVTIQPVTEDLAREFGLSDPKGALVGQVNKGSPAEKAGVQVGDVIVRFDGQPVTDTMHLRTLVASTPPGTPAEVVVMRRGREQTINIKLGELTSGETASSAGEGSEEGNVSDQIGLTVQSLTPDIARQFGYDKAEGVVVSEVKDGSSAADARLRTGDLIVEANRAAISSVDDFRRAIEKAKGKDTLLLLVCNQAGSRFVIVRLK